MKIGYPCINNSVGCTSNSTFRLNSYSEKRLVEKVDTNLDCLEKILEWNLSKGLLFFRIGSQLVPFASHKVCRFNWQGHFAERFEKIGRFVKKNNIRISMHPGQYTIINSNKKDIFKKGVKEVKYHCNVLDAMKLGPDAKVQLHVGGVYGNREEAIQRFVERYKTLDKPIRKRLVIENDDKCFSLVDCLKVNKMTGIPVLFDSLHHECLSNYEDVRSAVRKASRTWKVKDGKLMVDYSSKGGARCNHTFSINKKHFIDFLEKTKGIDFDVMLEIKDKEKSALRALQINKMKRKSQ